MSQALVDSSSVTTGRLVCCGRMGRSNTQRMSPMLVVRTLHLAALLSAAMHLGSMRQRMLLGWVR